MNDEKLRAGEAPRVAPDVAGGVAGQAIAGAVLRRRAAGQAVLLLAGLVLPNLLSLLSLFQFVDIGLPPRTAVIVLYATLAVCARRLPFAIAAILFVCLLLFDVVRTLSLMFGLAPTEFMIAFEHARRVELFTPPLYLALGGALATTSLIVLLLLRRKAALLRGNIYALFGLAMVLATADYAANVSPHFHFGSAFGRNQPIVSAGDVSGFAQTVRTTKRNVVMVIVEGLGYLHDADVRRRIASPLYDSAVTENYRVSEGQAVYYGSTTSGEMRELCHTNVFYEEFVPAKGETCLPERLDKRGYETIAVHGFSRMMFNREEWYPNVGFEQELFRKELIAQTGRICGRNGAFPGACDGDLAPVIGNLARKSAADGPLFIYWLTLNTHVPVPAGDARTDFRCASATGNFGHPTVCRMAELWHDVFAAVAAIARDPAISPAEILVVGDHAPPLWSRQARNQFEPGRVAWYRLTPRSRLAQGL